MVCLPACGFPTGSGHLSCTPTPLDRPSYPFCILWLTGGNIWTVLKVPTVCVVHVCVCALLCPAVLYQETKRVPCQSLLIGLLVGLANIKLASASRQPVTSRRGGGAHGTASWNEPFPLWIWWGSSSLGGYVAFVKTDLWRCREGWRWTERDGWMSGWMELKVLHFSVSRV